jgi:DNA processing protein
MKIQKVTLGQDFLTPLRDIPSPPQKLWLQGQLPEGPRPKVVSIVGSRKNTKYGEEVAYKLAYDLAKQGIVVVSGLAYGIDACAHRGCLDGDGITVAVLGTTIDHIYPASNISLAKKILEQGAILSEYGVGEITREWNFPERNRIVSGLADAVVIVEAAARSGTSITAAHALEQGKDVFAVPGDITRPMSVGCNRLIKQGALPFTETEDILGVLFPNQAKQLKLDIFGDSKNEQKIIDALKNGLRDGDQIIEMLGFSVSEFNQTVTLLEIKGIIRPLGANHWILS